MSKEKISRRSFLKTAGATIVTAGLLGLRSDSRSSAEILERGPAPLPPTETDYEVCLPDAQAQKQIRDNSCRLVDSYNDPEAAKDSRVLRISAGDGLCPKGETSVSIESYGGVGSFERCEEDRSQK